MPPRTTLSHLTDEELLRHVDAEHNPLTTTDTEIELRNRLAATVDELTAHGSVLEVAEEFDTNGEELRDLLDAHPGNMDTLTALLNLLADSDIYDVDQLKQLINLDKEFTELASDAGDFFTRLTALIATKE